MNIYPYCVFDYVYNCNSSFPFLIIMLNTCKLFTLTNYRYEYVVSSDKSLFNINNDFVQAIFSMFKKNSISIIDNAKLNKYIKQYNIKNITAYHYSIMNENNKKSYYLWCDVWDNEDYYPCKASIEILKSTIINKPYLLLKINLDGSIYSSFKNNSIYMIF
ncbi:hypothetical protein BCR36DRAFT_404264 [Piromyces finnis]|uniref:Uncharacterized protein n=1 Tax=Piromyces finnis TaxID=1754191 RepID=A0A1Y1V9V7_9FUNG|nr:hypothetical protein BCR36DRAFT_404264 [Piromyces finnis]|eukprot:ORX50624.1 hypothetical protein BCR36DRAFT_404264 [Piromyces finnis]